MNTSKNLPWISAALVASLLMLHCRPRTTSSTRNVSTAGVKGVAAPGKGFDIRSRALTENICVVSEKSLNQNEDSSSTEDSFSSDSSGTNLNFSLASTKPSDVVGKSKTFTVKFPATTVGTGMGLTGDQSGGSQIDLFYAHTLQELMVSLDATMQFEVGASRGGEGVQSSDGEFLPATNRDSFGMNLSDESGGSTGAPESSGDQSIASGSLINNFRTQLQFQYKSSTDKSFILLHGIKTFPTINSDTISNPKLNPLFMKAIFGGATSAAALDSATTYNEFRKYCGDFYVESIVRGREVWLVAVMESSQFNSLYQATGDLAHGSRVKAGDVGELKNNIKAHVDARATSSFLSEKVEIKVASRGKLNMNMGNFTFADALDKFNMFLNSVDASSTGQDEGALEVSLRNYDNVRYVMGSEESRLGNVFTTAVKNKSAKDVNVLSKLVTEGAWADKEYKSVSEKYRWSQWSQENNIYNGVANQAQALLDYRRAITSVLKYCGQISDEKNASEECLAKANTAAAMTRPVLNLPKPYDANVEFYFPSTLVSAVRADKKTDAIVLSQTDARAACRKLPGGNWVLPNATDWKRMVEASYFYTRWNVKTPGYRLQNDSNPLSLPCGSLNAINFWSDESDRAIQIAQRCSQDAVSLISTPRSFQYTSWFGLSSQNKGAYGCVRYRSN